jgi:hypothetical protein
MSNAGLEVLVSLIRTLLKKLVLSSADVRPLLTRVHPHDYAAPAQGAAVSILNELLPRFPEGRRRLMDRPRSHRRFGFRFQKSAWS